MINGNQLLKSVYQSSANLQYRKHVSLFSVCTTLMVTIIILGIAAENDQNDERSRRDLISFAFMMASKVKRCLFDYINYGNYCGVLGAGVPVDSIDKCCETHDHCYGDSVSLTNGKCIKYGKQSYYWMPYKWDMINDTINCDQYKDSSTKECQHYLCECDKAIVLCIQKMEVNYDTKITRQSSLWRIFQYHVLREKGIKN